MNNLRITTVRIGEEISYVFAAGNLVLGESSSGRLDDLLTSQINQEYRAIYVDMWDVKRIDAAGIGVLVMAYAHGKSKGTRVELVRLTDRTRELLALVKLLSVFEPQPRSKAA